MSIRQYLLRVQPNGDPLRPVLAVLFAIGYLLAAASTLVLRLEIGELTNLGSIAFLLLSLGALTGLPMALVGLLKLWQGGRVIIDKAPQHSEREASVHR